MAYRCFDVEIADNVAHLRLNRPEALNTLTREFWDELPAIVREIDENGRARAVVLSSTGRHFTAGLDLGAFGGDSGGERVEIGRARANLRLAIRHLQQAFTCLE